MINRVSRLRFRVVALSVFAAGCANDGSSGRVAVRDSAGIQIVENPFRTDGDSGIVRVAGRPPDLTIGVAEGDTAYEFYGVYGARRLSDGGIAVLNSGTYELRYYDEAGKFIRSVGRPGDGPGEFAGRFGPRFLCPLPADSLAVVDGNGTVVSVFDRSAGYTRRMPLPTAPDGRRLSIQTCSGRGSLLASTGIIRVEPQADIWSDSMQLVWVDADSMTTTSVGRFRYWDRYPVTRVDVPGVANLVFGRTLQVAAGEGEVFVGESADYEISVYGRDGKLKRLIRHEVPARPVTDSMKRAHEDASAREATARAAARGSPVSAPDEARYAKSLPPYTSLRAGRDGSLWVRRNVTVLLSDSVRVHRWDVFAPDGRWRAAIDLPADLDLLDSGPDYALGAWRNPEGVEFVHLYRFTMPRGN